MPEEYVIRRGDCVSSLAFNRGLNWETVWNHPNNASLKTLRGDPNILKSGDLLHIPDKTLKTVGRSTDVHHRFVRKGVPAKLRLRIVEDNLQQPPPAQAPPAAGLDPRHFVGEDPEAETPAEKDVPRADVPYVLNIDGRVIEGNTDADGFIECAIPPNAKSANLLLDPGTLNETAIPIRLGGLDPLGAISGVKHRLANLGFNCGDSTDESTNALAAALRAFQEKVGLSITGEPDDATRDRLRSAHGS